MFEETDLHMKSSKKSSKKKGSSKPKPLTASQKRARAKAVDAVREQGDTTLRAADYDPRARLRVLIGRPVGDATGGYSAYGSPSDATRPGPNTPVAGSQTMPSAIGEPVYASPAIADGKIFIRGEKHLYAIGKR